MIRTISIAVITMLLVSFIVYTQLSPKEILDNNTFTSIREDQKFENYFIIRGDDHEEFVNGELLAKSKIQWLPGNRFNAVLNWVRPEMKDKLPIGDTMKLELISFKDDILSLRVKFKDGHTTTAKYRRNPVINRRPGS